jgi:hypothetical protein
MRRVHLNELAALLSSLSHHPSAVIVRSLSAFDPQSFYCFIRTDSATSSAVGCFHLRPYRFLSSARRCLPSTVLSYLPLAVCCPPASFK